ncbi:MAG: HAD-IA family hydrolase [Nocardioides sp.]|uniref:HAD family hydrolase n=1 Tax=Nocardioides sp. TaxID=35761 RepID=UPI0039E2B011
MRACPEGPIRHVLFDADGVIQDVPGGWYAAIEPYLGERARDFLHETWAEGQTTLAGRGDYLPMLAASLHRWGVEAPVEQVYADVWCRIEVVEPTLAFVRELKASGYGVHLGTNQESYRASYMKANLGYDDLFDVCCYSCELGRMKPAPGFFERAVARIGAAPGEVLFIDDTEPNVVAARVAGLAAIHWDFTQGQQTLVDQVRGLGLRW